MQALILLRKYLVIRPCQCFDITLTATLTSAPQPMSSSHNDGTEDRADPDDGENGLGGTHIVADLWKYNNSTALIMLHFLIDGGGGGGGGGLVNGHAIRW